MTNQERVTLEAACASKFRYATRSAADKALKCMKIRKHGSVGTLRAYKCEACFGFHLGRKNRTGSGGELRSNG